MFGNSGNSDSGSSAGSGQTIKFGEVASAGMAASLDTKDAIPDDMKL